MANVLSLSDLTTDYNQFLTQFNNSAQYKETWKGTLTTMTAQTLMGFLSTIGTFAAGRIYRVYEDAYAETAQSDDAVRAIVQMQGLRMARYLPAQITVTLTSMVSITLDALTQFSAGSKQYFNRDAIELTAGVPQQATLYQGQIRRLQDTGRGTALQAFVTEEDNFVVSDRDVLIRINGVLIPKAYGGLWNYKGLPAYSDLTLADGRAVFQFGDDTYGTIPQVNDTVDIIYAVTDGADGNNQTIQGRGVTVEGFEAISGTVLTNPTGGANDKPIAAYKNVASGSFGTFLSAVTKSQYGATVVSYPGIIDAYTQAQREINPMDLKWMNVIRVSGLTQSPWSQQQKQDFIDYLQTVTMYAPRFVWQDPIPIDRDVNLEVYLFNTATLSEAKAKIEQAIINLFAPRPGLLGTDFFKSDLERAAFLAMPGLVSWTNVISPISQMLVGPPEAPRPRYTVLPGQGSLTQLQYSYGISTVLANGEEGPPNKWVFPQVTQNGSAIQLDWDPIDGASKYRIWGRRSNQIGLLGEVQTNQPLTFLDNGSINPSGGMPNLFSEAPIKYNRLRNLTVTVRYAGRQQRIDLNPTRIIT